ncbi:hypothetical protein KSD_86060 [Ktedonobacter sp. SOSP1-85]|uniref:hypothetical protein n=1 Tax=Ktedonobacter sp. SOSP1-85 TaxID=2778367 RepID=UPI00191599FE|nr:hypothetical protein [Ktedonobacter sp. SOSP1-85]GHO80835.1 hypothetical protein KSD_86060 [Ktedonobacter sp. SOSP1-85]
MRTNIAIPAFALREICIDVGKVLKFIRFDVFDGRIVIKALALGRVEITMKFRPFAENGKLVLQDIEVEGALWLANMSKPWIVSKIQKALEESSKKVFIHDISTVSDKIYLSFSPRKN